MIAVSEQKLAESISKVQLRKGGELVGNRDARFRRRTFATPIDPAAIRRQGSLRQS